MEIFSQSKHFFAEEIQLLNAAKKDFHFERDCVVPWLGAGEDELGGVDYLQLVGYGQVGGILEPRDGQPRPGHTVYMN